VVLTKLAVADPGKLAQIAYGLLPRAVFVQVQTSIPGNIDADTWGKMRSVLDLIERVYPADADPAVCSRTLSMRSAFAKPVDDAAQGASGWRWRRRTPCCSLSRRR
jgi:hypothetical protein